MAACLNNCNNQGKCNLLGECECFEDYIAKDCSRKTCPNQCTSRGVCDQSTLKCNCQPGYTTKDCSQKDCGPLCQMYGYCFDGQCFCRNGYIIEHINFYYLFIFINFYYLFILINFYYLCITQYKLISIDILVLSAILKLVLMLAITMEFAIKGNANVIKTITERTVDLDIVSIIVITTACVQVLLILLANAV